MKQFRSHKTVHAAKITGFDTVPGGANMPLEDGTTAVVDNEWLDRHAPKWGTPEAEVELVGGYFVLYEDGYKSWSPAEAFEQGYTLASLDPKDGALPVSGYKLQTDEKVAVVNAFKADEERILRKLDAMQDATRKGPNDSGPNPYDGRWLAIGRTQLEQAFMAINRAVFQPGRVELIEDEFS